MNRKAGKNKRKDEEENKEEDEKKPMERTKNIIKGFRGN